MATELDAQAPVETYDAELYLFRTEILKALAHPARLAMVDALRSGERRVCELQQLVGSALPTVSRHLSVLRATGLLACRREGAQIYYRLLVPCVVDMFRCLDQALLETEDRRSEVCCALLRRREEDAGA